MSWNTQKTGAYKKKYSFYLASVSRAGSLGVLVQWLCDNNLSLIKKGITLKEISIFSQNEKKNM